MLWEVLAQVVLGFVIPATAMDVKWLTLEATDCLGNNDVVIDNISLETCQAQCLAHQPDCKAIVWVTFLGNKCQLKGPCDPVPNVEGCYTSVVNVKWLTLEATDCLGVSDVVIDNISSLEMCQAKCLATQPACKGIVLVNMGIWGITCHLKAPCDQVTDTSVYQEAYVFTTLVVNWAELSGYVCDATAPGGTIEDLTSPSLSACQHECLARLPACQGAVYVQSSAACSVRSSCRVVYADSQPDSTVSVMFPTCQLWSANSFYDGIWAPQPTIDTSQGRRHAAHLSLNLQMLPTLVYQALSVQRTLHNMLSTLKVFLVNLNMKTI